MMRVNMLQLIPHRFVGYESQYLEIRGVSAQLSRNIRA